MKHLLTAVALLSLSACAPAQSYENSETTVAAQATTVPTTGPQAPFKVTRTDGLQEMIIAGGCFWCVEYDFEKITGVKEAISGYTGGGLDDPSYKVVGTNRTLIQQIRAVSFVIKARVIKLRFS